MGKLFIHTSTQDFRPCCIQLFTFIKSQSTASFLIIFFFICTPNGISIHVGRLTFLKKCYFEPPYYVTVPMPQLCYFHTLDSIVPVETWRDRLQACYRLHRNSKIEQLGGIFESICIYILRLMPNSVDMPDALCWIMTILLTCGT